MGLPGGGGTIWVLGNNKKFASLVKKAEETLEAKFRGARITNLHIPSSTRYNKNISGNKNDNLGPLRKGQDRSLDYRYWVLVKV